MKVRETRGFVLQVQQGALRDKSDMQVAEEMQSGWLQVPRIGYFAFPVTDIRGGTNQAEEFMDDAIKAARAQWTNGVAPDVEMISPIFEPFEGKLGFDARGNVEGPARVTFPSGNVYEGQFKGGRSHGRGTFTWAHGAVFEGDYKRGRKHGQGTMKYATGDRYIGEFENDKKHGRGIYTWAHGDVFEGNYQNDVMHGGGAYTLADGNVALLIYKENRPKGPGVRLEKASGLLWLLKDGKAVQKISQSQAWTSVFGRFQLCLVLATGPRGGEEARRSAAPL